MNPSSLPLGQGQVESQNFRFCGKEHFQDDEYNMTVTARENTERIDSVTYDNAKKLDTPCGEADVRPALSYRDSRLQARVNQATIFDCRDCNRVLAYARDASGVGVRFCSTGLNWGDAMVCTITDASFCNEVK